jgi:hypothetical protein
MKSFWVLKSVLSSLLPLIGYVGLLWEL